MNNNTEKIILDGSGKQKLKMLLDKQEIEPYITDFLRLIIQIILLLIAVNLVFIFIGYVLNSVHLALMLGFIFSIILCPVISFLILKNKEKELQ